MNARAPATKTYSENKHFDELLQNLAATQDREAFITIFNHFAPRIKGFLLRGGMKENDAEELAQETMMTVWQKADQFDPYMASATTWIYTIARNKKIDRLRKNSVPTLDLEDLLLAGKEPASETPDLDWSQGRIKDRLAQAIADLPVEQGALVKRAFYDDMSHAEIAQATHLPLGTVKSRLRIGLAKLRTALFDKNEVQ